MAHNRKDINPRRVIPADGYNKLRENLSANFRTDSEKFPEPQGFPTVNFPNPDNRASANRGNHISRKDDTVQDVSIGLQDNDEAIMYYFNNIIKPTVIVNGDRTPVPVIYGSPERWKGVQKDGFYRDKEGKIQTPLIMFKRDSVEKRRDLGNKLDGNNPQLFYTFQEKYTNKNRYDNFSVLQGRRPKKEFYAVAVPDFIKLTYTCTMWTDFVTQMNDLIEMVNYASDSYWGDPEKWKFNARIDNYSNLTEIQQGDNRIVKTTFGLTLQGYLVPDSINKELTNGNLRKTFSKAQVTFKPELVVEPTGEPITRKQVRNQQIAENIEQIGIGIGYQVLGESNKIN